MYNINTCHVDKHPIVYVLSIVLSYMYMSGALTIWVFWQRCLLVKMLENLRGRRHKSLPWSWCDCLAMNLVGTCLCVCVCVCVIYIYMYVCVRTFSPPVLGVGDPVTGSAVSSSMDFIRRGAESCEEPLLGSQNMHYSQQKPEGTTVSRGCQ